MNETGKRLRPLDSLDPPDVWRRATEREESMGGDVSQPYRSKTGRLLTSVVALTLFAGAAGLILRAFSEPEQEPGQTTPSYVTNLITTKAPMGLPITATYPADWSSRLISQSSLSPNGGTGPPGPPIGLVGIVVSNTAQIIADPTAPATMPQALPDPRKLPGDFVLVRILAVSGGAPQSPGPDSPLPLRLDEARTRNGGSLNEWDVRISGVDMTVLVSWGPDANDADIAAADQIVSSVTAT